MDTEEMVFIALFLLTLSDIYLTKQINHVFFFFAKQINHVGDTKKNKQRMRRNDGTKKHPSKST
jgi:hypothetical protein